jgi:hypothetical protein
VVVEPAQVHDLLDVEGHAAGDVAALALDVPAEQASLERRPRGTAVDMCRPL